jgi:hypothetical protein
MGSVGVGEQLMAVGEWVETGDWRSVELGKRTRQLVRLEAKPL